jgi:hypothetical protein
LTASLLRYTVAAKAVRKQTATVEALISNIKKAVGLSSSDAFLNQKELLDLCEEVQRHLATSTRMLDSL